MGTLRISNNPDKSGASSHDVEKQSDVDLNILQRPEAKNPDQALTLEQFRALVGLPQEQGYQPTQQLYQKGNKQYVTTESGLKSISQLHLDTQYPPPIRPSTIRAGPAASPYGSRAFVLLRLFSRPSFVRHPGRKRTEGLNDEAQEYATSLYYTVVRERSDQMRLYHVYNALVYGCLTMQLAIASALIILGAISTSTLQNGHRIAIAVLGAVTGLHTGVLSLLQGQGLPDRLLQYANRLQQVETQIELYERTLRAGVQGTYVTYEGVVDLWELFETIRNEQAMNKPSVWKAYNAMGPGGATFIQSSRRAAHAAEQQLRAPVATAPEGTSSVRHSGKDVEAGKQDAQVTPPRQASTRDRGRSNEHARSR